MNKIKTAMQKLAHARAGRKPAFRKLPALAMYVIQVASIPAYVVIGVWIGLFHGFRGIAEVIRSDYKSMRRDLGLEKELRQARRNS